MSTELAAAIRACFDDAFMSNPANMAWRSATGGGSRLVDIQVLLALQKPVAQLAGEDGPAAVVAAIEKFQEEGDPSSRPLYIVESFGRKQIGFRKQQSSARQQAAGSSGADSADADGTTSVQQQQHATGRDAASDVDARTVFASPIHFKATEAEISEFFSQFGKVVSVERRKYIERGIPKLRPSVFVMFATKEDADKCVGSRPSYGRCPSQLGSMFVPRLTVSIKGDPASRDALADEDTRLEAQKNRQQQQADQQQQQHDDGEAAVATHRRLINRGCICVAREIPADVPHRDVKSKLGSIRGVGEAIDSVFMPPTTDATKLAYVYCTSPATANTLLSCYNRVFSANEPYGATLGKAVPRLEKCRDAEEEVAMQIYSDAVAARTQKKMEKNAKRRQRDGDD